jgi:hypothetical protein
LILVGCFSHAGIQVYPAACSKQTINSGCVSLLLTARIVRERASTGVFITFFLDGSRAAESFVAAF